MDTTTMTELSGAPLNYDLMTYYLAAPQDAWGRLRPRSTAAVVLGGVWGRVLMEKAGLVRRSL